MMRPIRSLCLAAAIAVAAAAPTVDAADGPAVPKTIAVFTDCPDCPQMVVVPAGAFDMGSSPEEQHWYGVPQTFADQESPRHRVTVARPFAMSRTEVTRELYARFADETGHKDDPKGCSAQSPTGDVWQYQKAITWRRTGLEVTPQHPIQCVSWLDGQALAAWLSKKTGHRYRLPTDAEWEYAARGGTTTAAYWGDTSEAMCAHANVMNSATYALMRKPDSWKSRLMCSGETTYTVPVGSYPPNPFGLSDMIGNVWEWVEDCSHSSQFGAPKDGSAWVEPGCKTRTIRGGAFHSAPFFGRAATREGNQIPDHVSLGVGLRMVRDLDGPPPPLVQVAAEAPVIGDAVAGERQFAPCTKCHTVAKGAGDMATGPALHGIFGRAAGMNSPAFAYSGAMQGSGVVWTDETLDAWIENPPAVIPGNQMTYSGQPNRQIRANMVAYMKQVLR